MKLKRTLLTAMLGLLFAAFGTMSAHAFCGTIRASAGGLSDEDALKSANAIGLAKVRQLNQRYGNRVTYQPAKHNCRGASHSTCVITQTYCVADSPRQGFPKCGPNSVPAPNDAGCVCKTGFVRSQGECITRSAAEPWNSSACRTAKLGCSSGVQSACRRLESVCNPN